MDGPDLGSIAAILDFRLPQWNGELGTQLIILLVALLLCALASAAETALTSISRIKLKNLVEEGDQSALKIDQLLAEPNTFLTTVLIVHVVSIIVAAVASTLLALHFFASWGQLIASVLLALIVLLFCEIVPKTAAVQSPMSWVRILVTPIRLLARLLSPVVWLLRSVTRLLVHLTNGRLKRSGPFVTEEELRMLLTVGEEEGVLEEDETEMIHSIFEFADTTTREVMIPRIDMVTLADTTTVLEAVDVALQGGFSRIPVYDAGKGVDEIIGILYTKDLLKQLRDGQTTRSIRSLVRPAYFVPETKKLDDLLSEIRQNRVHIVIVVDEYGSVSGLVTIEDLVEEIVGDIKDEYDHEENPYEKVSENEYIFDAMFSIDDFNDLMDTHLSNEDYETLGGFVYAQLDKIPGVGDVVSYEDLTFTVLATRGRRILKIRVQREQKPVESQPGQDVHTVPLVPTSEKQSDTGVGQQPMVRPTFSAFL